MSEKITLKDIAEKLNISQNTVSLALRDMPGISPKTRELIQKTATDMGYESVKLRKDAENICIISTIDNGTDTYFYIHVQKKIEEKLNENGYNLVIFNNLIDDRCNTSQLSELFESSNIKGIIILGDIDIGLAKKIVQCDLPVVGISFYFSELFIDSVIEDNISGMVQAVKHLYDKGYRKIGFIGEIQSTMSFLERYMGYLGALKKLKLENNPDYNLVDLSCEQLYDYNFVAEQLKQKGSLPEAFVCANDKVALIAAKALYCLDYEVPKDIGLVGFDNSELAKFSIPSLTTIDTNRDYQAIRTVECILEKIINKDKKTERIVIPVKLIEGESIINISHEYEIG